MIRRKLISVITVGALGGLPFGAFAQDIVVNGSRALAPEAARSYVAQITRATGAQLARFHTPICPAVMGMTSRNARIVQNRIRSIAGSVGADVDSGQRCNANVIVMIASDPAKLFDDARRHKLSWFNGLRAHDIGQLARAPGPVKAWHVTSLRNEDGHGTGIYGEDLEGATLQVRSASYIRKPTRQHIDGAVLIIDRQAIEGLSLNQIASYAAMRALARTEIPSDPGADTILGLFSTGAVRVPELSSSDVAYLKALYAGKGTENANAEIVRIARALVSER